MDSNLAKDYCSSGKKCYKTEQQALVAAREGMLFRNVPKLDVYFCLQCYNYHLTSSIKDKSKRKRK